MGRRTETASGSRERSFRQYAAVTLVLTVAAILGASFVGRREAMWGIGAAWGTQAVAFQRLMGALGAGRRATGAWLGGIGARFGMLALLGGIAYVGGAGNDLPIAYGIAMLVLLLMEAGWLMRMRPDGVAPDGDTNETDRTRSTG